MATTIEELQILLKCDATQAQATLESLQTAVDKTFKKMSKGGSAGGGKGQTWFEKTNEKLKKTFEEIGKASLGIKNGDVGAKENYAHYIEQAKKLKSELEKAGNAADKAFGVGKKGGAIGKAIENMSYLDKGAKKVSDRLNNMPNMDKYLAGEATKEPTVDYRGGSQPVPYKGWQPVSVNDLNNGYAGEAQRRALEAIGEAAEQTKSKLQEINLDKLTNGTPYERLSEKLKMLGNFAQFIKDKMASIGDTGDPAALLTLQTRLDTIEKKAEKVAQEMAKIEDEAASNGSSETASNVEQTGNAAENAAPKVERYGKAVKNAGSSSGFFGRMSKAAHGIFSKFGGSFKKHEGFLSKFGKTLKRVIMRMMAMGLVRGVIRGFTQGLQMLAKASPAAAEQFGRFTAMTKAVKAALGSAALAVLNAFASVLYNVASAAVTAANAVARFFGALGGGKYFAVSMADGFDNLSDSMSGAGGAAKGMLADFDELNVIGQQGGGGGGAGNGIGNATVSEQDAQSVLADLLNSGMFEQAGAYVAAGLDKIVLKIDDFFLDVQDKHYGTKFAEFINGIFKDKKLFEDAGKTVGDGVNTIIYTIEDFAASFDGKTAGESLAAGVNTMVETIDWDAAGRAVSEGTNKINDAITAFVTNFNGDALGEGLATAISNAITGISWDKIGAAGVVLLINAVDFVLSFLANMDWFGISSGIIELIISAPLQVIEGILARPSRLIRIIKNFIKLLLKTNITLFGSLIMGIFDYIVNSSITILNTLFPRLKLGDKLFGGAKEASQRFKDGLDEGLDKVLAPFDLLADEIDKKMGFIEDSTETHGGHSGKFIEEWGSQVSATAETVNSSLDGSASVLEKYKKKAEEMATGVSKASDKTADFSSVLTGSDFSANTFDTLSESILTLCGILADAFGVTEKWADALKKIPKKIDTTYTFKANVEATASGSSTATVNKPNINVNLTMASGGIAYGETLARIGEYPNAHTNPEVVAPLNKLQGILEKANGGNKANSADVKRQNELLTEQNRLLRIIAQKEIKLSPSPELGQVVTKATALYGAV